MNRIWMALCLLALLTGCSRVQEAWMPVAEKVNAAYPVDPEARLLQERLEGLLAGQAEALKRVQAQVDARLTLRALNCVKDKAIGRFDALESVKALELDRACFAAQDVELRTLLGLRSIGVLLAKPPLRPFVALGKPTMLPSGKLTHVSHVLAASAAGVALLRGSEGEMLTVEIPGGKVIGTLSVRETSGAPQALSPNGRIAVLRKDGREIAFMDAETGAALWSASDAGAFLAWLPEVGAALLNMRDGGLALLDLETGQLSPHPLSLRNRQSAVVMPGTPQSVLLLGNNELAQIAHKRGTGGIEATLVRAYSFSDELRVAYGMPLVMREGQLAVFRSHGGIGWLELESGRSGMWKTGPMLSNEFAQLDDLRLLVDGREYGASTTRTWAYHIVDQTLSPLEPQQEVRGSLADLGGRPGFVRRGSPPWVGDQVDVGQPVKLDDLMSEYNLQIQLARLKAQSEQAMAQSDEASMLNALRRGDEPARVPGLPNLPSDAVVHVVGIYEGGSRRPSTSGGESLNPVRVEVRPSSRPIVLALASYEPVRWIVRNQGARIAAILVSGHNGSSVIPQGSQPVLRIGSAYAYTAAGSDYPRLKQQILQYTGPREIRSFQGSYRGSEFSVGP